jgi:hypothetical protein
MELDHPPVTPVPPSEPSYGIISLSTAAAALFSTGYPLLALIALIVTLLLVSNFVSTTDSHQGDMSAVRSISSPFLRETYYLTLFILVIRCARRLNSSEPSMGISCPGCIKSARK